MQADGEEAAAAGGEAEDEDLMVDLSLKKKKKKKKVRHALGIFSMQQQSHRRHNRYSTAA
jgi:hypothetical protein